MLVVEPDRGGTDRIGLYLMRICLLLSTPQY